MNYIQRIIFVFRIPEQKQPIIFESLILLLKEKFPDYTGEMFEAYFYAGAVILSSVLNVILMHPYMLSQLHIGMKMRVAMCSMIYRKALRLSRNALGETTAGQVVNLLSNDVGRLDLSILFIHYLWVGPVETIIVTYLMYLEVRILKQNLKNKNHRFYQIVLLFLF